MAEPKKPETRKKGARENKPRLVSTQVTNEAYQKLREKAAKEDRTIGYLIRRFILDGLGLDSKAA